MISMNKSATIKLFLPFGNAQGIRTAEISNWSGKAVAAPRSELKHFMSRDELKNPGVYFLIGDDEESGVPLLYIGEAESVTYRLKQHLSKEFWNSVIAVFSKDENLTKAHVRYLEGRLIEIAQDVGKCKLVNGKGGGSKLLESDLHDMEVFLSRVAQLLPVLGCNFLTPTIEAASTIDLHNALYCARKGAKATGVRSANGFTVFKGSSAVKDFQKATYSSGKWIIRLRDRLCQAGSLVLQGEFYVFAQDVEFSSPSAAAAIVTGGSAQGPAVWRNADGKSLKDIEASSGLLSLSDQEPE